MASPDTYDQFAPPGRSFQRYAPRFNPTDYPRHQHGSTLVDDLANEGVSGSGGRSLQAECGMMKSRLARVNQELFDLQTASQQGGERSSVRTPQPRRREGSAPVSGHVTGERVARTRQLGSSPRQASPLRPRDARFVRVPARGLQNADQPGGSSFQPAGRRRLNSSLGSRVRS